MRVRMGGGLRLSAQQVQMILRHLRSEYPNEACGLLGGRDGCAEKVYPLPNVMRSPVAYEVDPRALLEALMDMEDRGCEPVPLAIYHSHPHSEAYPSATDVRLAYYPDSTYLIVSLEHLLAPVMRAFRIVDGEVTEETVLVQ